MKKLFLFGALAIASTAFGQRIQKGESQLNAGLGLGSSWGIPVYVGIDHGVHKDVTIGGQISFANVNEDNFSINWFSLSANANYHFNSLLEIPNNWDVYAGLSLVYNNYSNKYKNGLDLGLQIGGRYFFNDKFGVNLEFGGGDYATGGKVGITYKF